MIVKLWPFRDFTIKVALCVKLLTSLQFSAIPVFPTFPPFQAVPLFLPLVKKAEQTDKSELGETLELAES